MTSTPSPLRELTRLFLKLGTIAFGGPAAHVAMMRDEVVTRRGWMDDQEFLDHVGATNLVPGPNSTELAIAIGNRRAGWRGLLVAGVCFILPAFVIVTVLAALYRRYGDTPAVVDLRYGVLPVIIAIVAQALWGLGRTAVKGWLTGALAAGAAVAWLAGVNELVILAVGAVVAWLWGIRPHPTGSFRLLAPLLAATSATTAAAAQDPTLWRLFLVFLKVGAVLYGSGYVLLAFLESDLVDRYGWLTEQQLLDAVAVGQFTPGPVFTTATFVGYQVQGFAGAVVATVGIFAPAFAFVALLSVVVAWMRRTPAARHALNGINAASLGLMAGVTVRLSDAAFPDALTVAVGVAALAVLLRWKPNSAWLVGAGALIGLVHGLA